MSSVARDVQAIIDSNPTTGIVLNSSKCENTVKNFEIIDKFSIVKNFKRVAAEELTLLGTPVLEGRAVDNTLKDKIATTENSIKRLPTLQSHDALYLLKNLIAMPKLLYTYILRSSPCSNYPILQQFDMVLTNGLEETLNVEHSDTQGKQASLPVHMRGGGLGVRSACMLTPSAFLTSPAAILPLQEAILSASATGADDTAVSNITTT